MKAPIANLVHVFWLIIASWPSTSIGQGVWVYAPPAVLATNDGNWVTTTFDVQAGRFQQVFAASNFPDLSSSGGGFIKTIVFRPDAVYGNGIDEILPSVQLNLSTTTLVPDGLSAVFDNNVGPNDTIVRGPGSVHIVSGGGGGSTGFDAGFNLETPFFYNPADGNLLLDVRIYQGFGTRPGGILVLDAFDVTGDSVSSVFAAGTTVPTTGLPTSIGLATAFAVTPIPEPQPLLMLLVGAAVLTFLHLLPRRRVRRLIYEQNIADLYAFDSDTALAPVGNVTIAYTPLFMFPQAIFRENVFRYLDDAPAVAGANGQRSYAFGLYSFSDTLIENNLVGLIDPHLIYHGLSHNVRAFNNMASSGETLPLFHDLSGGGTSFEQGESLEDRVRDTLFFALL